MFRLWMGLVAIGTAQTCLRGHDAPCLQVPQVIAETNGLSLRCARVHASQCCRIGSRFFPLLDPFEAPFWNFFGG